MIMYLHRSRKSSTGAGGDNGFLQNVPSAEDDPDGSLLDSIIQAYQYVSGSTVMCSTGLSGYSAFTQECYRSFMNQEISDWRKKNGSQHAPAENFSFLQTGAAADPILVSRMGRDGVLLLEGPALHGSRTIARSVGKNLRRSRPRGAALVSWGPRGAHRPLLGPASRTGAWALLQLSSGGSARTKIALSAASVFALLAGMAFLGVVAPSWALLGLAIALVSAGIILVSFVAIGHVLNNLKRIKGVRQDGTGSASEGDTEMLPLVNSEPA